MYAHMDALQKLAKEKQERHRREKRQGLFKGKKKNVIKNEHCVIWVLPPHVAGKKALYCLSIKDKEVSLFFFFLSHH